LCHWLGRTSLGPHIQALAQIAELLNRPTLVKKLLEAQTPGHVLEIMRAEEQR
jgi:mannitol/fructose-specific phosphotransferase system IIA component (Ntr-type)